MGKGRRKREKKARALKIHASEAGIADLKRGLEEQRRKFRERFGRDPGPDDPIFFDSHPEALEHTIVEAMKKTGIHPSLIYAYERTGRIVTAESIQNLTDEELAEYNAALDEWDKMHPE